MTENKMSKVFISEEMINNELKSRILAMVDNYLTGYHINFADGNIYLDLKLRVKSIGDISVKYLLKVLNFTFNEKEHSLKVAYLEDVKSEGNPVQKMMLKALSLKNGTFLQTAVGMANLQGITAEEKNCSIDIEQLVNLKGSFLSKLSLQYLDSRDGALQLSFSINS